MKSQVEQPPANDTILNLKKIFRLTKFDTTPSHIDRDRPQDEGEKMVRFFTVAAIFSAFFLGNSAAVKADGCAKAICYTYDAIGRLSVVTYNDGTTITYSYDNAGNRTSVKVCSPTAGC